VVPYLAEELGMKYKIARNAEVISPIGVALAMVRDIVERTIANPTDDDILMVRREAEQQALKSGASPGTIDVFIEADAKNNIVRAIATGATELKTKNRLSGSVSEADIIRIAEETMKADQCGDVSIAMKTDDFYVVSGSVVRKKLFGLVNSRRTPMRIVNSEGVVRIQCQDGRALTTDPQSCMSDVDHCLGKLIQYSDGGEKLPQMYVMIGARLLDFSKLASKEQMEALLQLELAGVNPDEKIMVVFQAAV